MPMKTEFQAVSKFGFKVNRSERTQQVRFLVPLLTYPEGRVWFLKRLKCPCTPDEARGAEVFHFCNPLADLFYSDYRQCRGNRHLEDQLIAHYSRLFHLGEDLALQDVWRTAPGGEIRHPAARGRAGWHDGFLKAHIPDEDVRERARQVRNLLRTEADALLLTAGHIVVVECKYQGSFDIEQSRRQMMMGEILASQLDKTFHAGLVVDDASDPEVAKAGIPCVRWSEIEDKLEELACI